MVQYVVCKWLQMSVWVVYKRQTHIERKKRREVLVVLTWSLAGRCCWAPSCPVIAPTPVWWVHLQYQEPGRGWGCAPLSGCSCSGCWPTDGTSCGGCVEGAAEAVVWTDCGLQALKKRKEEKKQQLHFFFFFCWDDSKRFNWSHAFSSRQKCSKFGVWFSINDQQLDSEENFSCTDTWKLNHHYLTSHHIFHIFFTPPPSLHSCHPFLLLYSVFFVTSKWMCVCVCVSNIRALSTACILISCSQTWGNMSARIQ